jgi:hypothetical protein
MMGDDMNVTKFVEDDIEKYYDKKPIIIVHDDAQEDDLLEYVKQCKYRLS